ncbi:MAG: hypothetical protein L3J86_04685 [Thermoplasmata archaeon]|nr:hypothetical protein [Thermoplasmata archaeon]
MTSNRTHRVARDRFRVFLDRAEDLSRTMHRSLSEGDVNGAGLAAIHCAIAASDALTTFHLEERSTGQDHSEATRLVRRLPVEGWETFLTHLESALAEKSSVEYEAKIVSSKQAAALVLAADRALRWARKQLPSPRTGPR